MTYFTHFSGKGSKIPETEQNYLFSVIPQKGIFCHYILDKKIFPETYLFWLFLCDYDTSKLTGKD